MYKERNKTVKQRIQEHPNFTVKELACRHCGKLHVTHELLDNLFTLRRHLGFALIITSGYRCMNHPEERTKKTIGMHVQGLAVDIYTKVKWKRALIIQTAIKLGFKGIGIADEFVHLDLRKDAAVWTYDSKVNVTVQGIQ